MSCNWILKLAVSVGASLCGPLCASSYFSASVAMAQAPTSTLAAPTPVASTAAMERSVAPEADFQSSLAAFKKGETDRARDLLLNIDRALPDQRAVLNNLAVIAAHQSRYGAAIALWRKAQYDNPTDDSIEASIQWALKKLPKTEIAREYDWWEGLREGVLQKTSLVLTVSVSAVLMVLAGWSIIRWWGRRQRALAEELALPPPPLAGSALLLLFVLLSAVSLAQFVDRVDLRGTILPKKVEVRTAADPTATVLFEVFEGMEVFLVDSRNVDGKIWRRIHYPGGMSGWIPDREVMSTADAAERAFP